MNPSPPPPAPEGTPPAVNRATVVAFFVALDKAIRARKLYRKGSALVERFYADLDGRLAELLQAGPVTVRVASAGLLHEDRLLEIEDRHLTWSFRLFCDGVRELTFLPGLRFEEAESFLDVLLTNYRRDEDDLVTLLWRAGLEHIRYFAADTFAAGLEVEEDGELVVARKQGQGTDRAEDLPPDDLRRLSGDEHLRWLRVVKAPSRTRGANAWSVARIKEDLGAVEDQERFLKLVLNLRGMEGSSPVDLALGVADAALDGGNPEAVARTLEAALEAAGRNRPVGRALLAGLLARVRIRRLAQVMVESPEPFLPLVPSLVERGEAERLMELVANLSGPLEEALAGGLWSTGCDLTTVYAERLTREELASARTAIQTLGRLGHPKALAVLGTAITRGDAEVQKEALRALGGRYVPALRTPLLHLLRDPDPEVRMLTLDILARADDPTVARVVLELVDHADFVRRTAREQAALYACLARFKDERTMAHFRAVLSRPNLFHAEGTTALQLLAVRGLAETDEPEATAVLQEFRSRWTLPHQVKVAIRAALARKGRHP